MSRHQSIHLDGLTVERIRISLGHNDKPYCFNARPKRPRFINSSCWKGFVAHYELEQSGGLALKKYVVDGEEQIVNEAVVGDFWLELRGSESLFGYATIEAPFTDGRIVADFSRWTGDQRLLCWVRLTSAKTSSAPDGTQEFGAVKWFGGINGKTGRVNDFGFIATEDGDLYFHRTDSQSTPDALTPGAEVVFERSNRKGKVFATAVRVLSLMADAELIASLKRLDRLTARQALLIALHCSTLSLCESEAYAALVVLADENGPLLDRFWKKHLPRGPSDPLFTRAPASVKRTASRRHYDAFLRALTTVFEPLQEVQTAFSCSEVYDNLDERDDALARLWTNASNPEDPVLAKMLSARAAEKVAAAFYKNRGIKVEDVSIQQLGSATEDWLTHDLLLSGIQGIDVKNARTPVHANNFYVEHTVARFKLDRQQRRVKIAGVLSPYLQLQYIKEPRTASFRTSDVVFLGETSRDDIDQLGSAFASAGLEILRGNERTVPNWLFAYSSSWCPDFLDAIRRLAQDVEWPRDADFLEQGEWDIMFNRPETLSAIPALYVTGKPLPESISSKLTQHQREFLKKMRAAGGNLPSLPTIFFVVLTDFLARLPAGQTDYSPKDYVQLLYPDDPWSHVNAAASASYPLGAVDPLSLIRSLIATLIKLWECRDRFDLPSLASYRFSGLGVLQGRSSNDWKWVTLIAYCGGTVYEKDASGIVLVDRTGKPRGIKGKCGKSPLVLGEDACCAQCGRLICGKCGFCSVSCQDALFKRLAKCGSSSKGAFRAQYFAERPNEDDVGFDLPY